MFKHNRRSYYKKKNILMISLMNLSEITPKYVNSCSICPQQKKINVSTNLVNAIRLVININHIDLTHYENILIFCL